MTGFWPIFFLLVVLKIPVVYGIWLVWWASKAPEVEEEPETDGGGFKRRRPRPKLPRGPRRGPHGGGAAAPAAGLPAGRPHPGRQAGAAARFRSRRISRR